MKHTLALILAPLLLATPAAADIYVLDGDSIVVDREHIRLVGFNAPETRDAQCESERAMGYRAKARLHELLTAACGPLARAPAACLTLERLAAPDRYGRSLARLVVQGRDVATILISERLAEPYDCPAGHCPRRRNWCGDE